MACKCGPPSLVKLRPPPDPSLVWHLISEEPFQKAPTCEWTGSSPSSLSSPPLLLLSLLLLFLLLLSTALVCAFCLLRRNRRKGTATSTEAIVSGDHLWSYNSMKSHQNIVSHQNGLSGSMYGSGMVHGIATPTSLRELHNKNGALNNAIRHTNSAQLIRQSTLRIIPGNPPAASPFHSLGRHYEEIGDPSYHSPLPQHFTRGGLPYVVNCSREGISYTLGPAAGRPPLPPARPHDISPPSRHSVRRPPPACRPPPPPSSSSDLSPRSCSSNSSSFDHELSVIGGHEPQGKLEQSSHDSVEGENSPPLKGRESGYGTAPSRQWKSPQGSGNKSLEDLPVPVPQSMTYV